MPFSQRNIYYLRTSAYSVLQLVLYLDQRHVAWMNENPLILERVLEVLRTRCVISSSYNTPKAICVQTAFFFFFFFFSQDHAQA